MKNSNDFDEAEAFSMAGNWGKNATEEDVQNVAQNMGKMNRGPLAKIWNQVTQIWEAFKSPKTPAPLKALLIGSLIYMISPIDLISDFIPFVGLLDDASVIGIAFRQLMKLGAAAALVTSTIRLVKINKQILLAEMQKREWEKLIVREMPNARKLNCLGIHSDGTQEEVTFESESDISREIKQGMTLTTTY